MTKLLLTDDLSPYYYIHMHTSGSRGTVIVWQLDSQLHMQSVPITIDVVSSNLDQGGMYNIM
jgi:hypothetical protein